MTGDLQYVCQRRILHKGIRTVEVQYIGDVFGGKNCVQTVIIIPGIDHDDLLIIGQQELNKAVGIGILEQQQDPLVICRGADFHLGMVAAEEHGILVLVLKSAALVNRANPLGAVGVGDIITNLTLGNIDLNGIRGLVAAAFGGKRAFKAVRDGVDIIILHWGCNPQLTGAGGESIVSAQRGPVMVGLVINVLRSMGAQRIGCIQKLNRTG